MSPSIDRREPKDMENPGSSSRSQALIRISPYTLSSIGVAVSILGAACGIYVTGSSLIGAAIKAPRITSENLISVIFCETVAIYGVIIAIILQTKLESVPPSQIYAAESLRAGYAILASGDHCRDCESSFALGLFGVIVGLSCHHKGTWPAKKLKTPMLQ